MTPSSAADVVVVGAGPAGTTAARLLSAWGRSVLVLSRAPTQRWLAESLPPSCSRLLERVGVRRAVDAAGFVRASGNTVRWGGGERVEAFPDGATGYQIGRERFDALLLREALEAGARLTSGATARVAPTRDADGHHEVRYTSRIDSGTVRAPWVLDCSGRAGAATTTGARRAEDVPRTLALAAVWESDPGWDLPDPTHTLVESFAGGWAWSVPDTLTRRYLTLMLDPTVTPLHRSAGPDVEYERQLARAEWMHALVALPAHQVGRAWACDATPWCAAEVASDGVLRVGDAASFVDPLSSYGIKKALASAWLAAVVVNTALADAALALPSCALYKARERAMYQALTRQSAVLAGAADDGRGDRFWEARVDAGDALDAGGADEDPTRSPALAERMRAAFSELKRRERVTLRVAAGLERTMRPVVQGERISLREHLAGASLPSPIRYLRNVDLVELVRLAPQHEDVPSLYAAYARAAAPVPLPDFLTALTTLIATDALGID